MTPSHFFSLLLLSSVLSLNSSLVLAQGGGTSYVRFACENITSNDVLNTNLIQKTAGTVIFEQEYINEEGCQLTDEIPFTKNKHLPCTGENVKNNLVNSDFRYHYSNDISFKVTLHTDTHLKLKNKSERERSQILDQMLAASGHKPYDPKEKAGYIKGPLKIETGNGYTFKENGGRGFEINGFYNVNFEERFQMSLYTNNRDGVKYSSALESFVCFPPELVEITPISPENVGETAVK